MHVDKRPQWGIRQPMYSACKLTTGNTEDKHALFLILVLSTGLAVCLVGGLLLVVVVIRTVPYRSLATLGASIATFTTATTATTATVHYFGAWS